MPTLRTTLNFKIELDWVLLMKGADILSIRKSTEPNVFATCLDQITTTIYDTTINQKIKYVERSLF